MTDDHIVYAALRDFVPSERYYGADGARAAFDRIKARSNESVLEALRDLQRAVRTYTLGLGNELKGKEWVLEAERKAREVIEQCSRSI